MNTQTTPAAVIANNRNEALCWLNQHGFVSVHGEHRLNLDSGGHLSGVIVLPLSSELGTDPVLCNRVKIAFKRFCAKGFRA